MKFVVLDSTAVVKEGPGSPAYFSRFVIRRLKQEGHEIVVADGFDAALCASTDVVWSEWCNEEAYEAAASGVCKRLVIRMRGFDVWGPLEKMAWQNVDALVYESRFVEQLAMEGFLAPSGGLYGPSLAIPKTFVIPSGVDLASIPFKERKHGNVLALVARAVSDKGYQLAFEFARQHPSIRLHVATALGEHNPRLMRYLKHSAPRNVEIHGTVDTVPWLESIDANYLLSASIWETLGYTIAEALAMGIKPLVHDIPGAELNWPSELIRPWRSFDELHREMTKYAFARGGYDSQSYRDFVARNLEADTQSISFIQVLTAPTSRVPARPPTLGSLLNEAQGILASGDLVAAEAAVQDFRDRAPRRAGMDDFRAGLAFNLGAALFEVDRFEESKVWALRSLSDVVRTAPLALLGEVAAEQGDFENAVRWYQAASGVENVNSSFASNLDSGTAERLADLQDQVRPKFERVTPPKRYLVIVPVRNAEDLICECLRSIRCQMALSPDTQVLVSITDDASTDATFARAQEFMRYMPPGTAVLERNVERRGSLRNVYLDIQLHWQPGDVVVIVDGDDALKDDALLFPTLDRAYSDGAWLTYGSFVTSSGRRNWMPPYSRSEVEAGAFRGHPWKAAPLRTFKAELFDRIALKDLRDDAGNPFMTAGDAAFMFPMLEMAGHRAFPLTEVLYFYNDERPDNDHRKNSDEQVRVRDLIASRPPYKRLEKL